MLAARAGVIVAAALSLLAAARDVAAQRPPSPGTPPHVLNVVRVKIKPRAASSYAALEAQIVRAYDRAKVPLYWICLQASRNPTDVLYLNLFDTSDAFDRAAAIYREAVKQHPELAAPHQRLTDLTASSLSTLTTRRDDVDRTKADVDFATMRTIRLTLFQVLPGREGEFLKAIRTTSSKEGSWLVYEANDSSTYALMTLKRTAIGRKDGPAVPRALRRFKGLAATPQTVIYQVRPAMSHVTQAFVAANPQLWRPATANH